MRYWPYFGILVGLLFALAAVIWRPWVTSSGPEARPLRPNVVLVSLDTTRADHLSCYGYARPTSPNLDRLAARGVRYANARAQFPMTLPLHMALFTSLLPSHCQVTHVHAVLSPLIPTLAEILQNNGYQTAGLVNDGQMKARFGFQRGFKDWREFRAQTPEGDCVHVTDAAVQWLGAAPTEPFFLFLHYYDPHAPYDPPEEFRRRFGSTLSGADTERIVRRPRNQRQPIRDPRPFNQEVIGSYDGEIAWLDQELGRLFATLPHNTLVVVFADHGEAFKEQGWTEHGSSLYEEEVHVPLLMSLPGVLPQDRVMKEPVMLLDVAPTILGLCGVPAPFHYEGVDLRPTWSGGRLPERPVLSEVTVHYGGQAVKMVALGEWKLIRSVFDGREELYRLPDEQTDLSQKEAPVRDALSALARRWIAEEDFWTVYAHGPGEFSAGLVPQSGQFINVVLFGERQDSDHSEFDPSLRSFSFTWRPGERTKGMFFKIAPADAPVHFDLRIDGKRLPDKVFCGTTGEHPAQLPIDLTLDGAASDPVIDKPFQASKPGFFVFHHRAKRTGGFPAIAQSLDEATIQQLRSLGYLQ